MQCIYIYTYQMEYVSFLSNLTKTTTVQMFGLYIGFLMFSWVLETHVMKTFPS